MTIKQAVLHVTKGVFMTASDICKKLLSSDNLAPKLAKKGKTPFRTVNGICQKNVKEGLMTRFLGKVGGKTRYFYGQTK